MEYQQAKSLIGKLARQIKLLSFGMAGLLLCNAVLGLLLWHQSDRRDVILIPSTLHQKAVLTDRGVSNTYLEAMATMLVNDRLNVTPENIHGSNQHILTFVNAQDYAAFKKQLSTDARTIINRKIASAFYVNRVRSNPNTLTVTVDGRLKRWVGERLIGFEPKRYRLTFSRQGYSLLLTSFQEIKQ